MYASMADLQEGLELTQKTDSFGGGKHLNVEILQWHSNNHFYGEYFDDSHFEKEIRRLGKLDEETQQVEPIKTSPTNQTTENILPEPSEPSKDEPMNTLEKKIHLKKRKQQLQRSMDMWETQQNEEEVPEVILRPIPSSGPRNPGQVPTIQILNTEPLAQSTPTLVEPIPIIQLDLVPVEVELENKGEPVQLETIKSPKTRKLKKKKITFFNSEEEEQQKDTFIESKSAFEYYLDSLAQESQTQQKFSRCSFCKVTFKSPLELSVHFSFDNAHKMILQEKLDCISFRKN